MDRDGKVKPSQMYLCRFGVFGYITKGLDDTVTKLAAGDKIVEARITSGLEKLVNG